MSAPSTPKFVAARHQDAWALFRGVKYQVDVTLLRWLALTTGEALELERGEDIDLVFEQQRLDPDLAQMDQAALNRLLEQVRHHDEHLTLRHPKALTALVTFHEHRDANPDLRLRYRYATNTSPGLERPPATAERLPGLVIWQRLTDGAADETQTADDVRGLLTLLRAAARPDDVTEERWFAFRAAVLRDDTTFLPFVRAFEWGVEQPDAVGVSQLVRERLASPAFGFTALQAESRYRQLFLHVLDRIGQSGLKRLDVTERGRVLAQPAEVGASPSALAELLLDVQDEIRGLRGRVDTVEQAMAGVHAQLTLLARDEGIDVALAFTSVTPELTAPQPPPGLVSRDGTVDGLVTRTRGATWLALVGEIGLGKTELARALAARRGFLQAWVAFGGVPEAHASVRLDAALAVLAGVSFLPAAAQRYAGLAARLSAGAVVVLDDLPDLRDSELAARLYALALALSGVGATLVTTSTWDVPPDVRRRMNRRLQVLPVPAFSPEEAADVLRSHGADDGMADRLALFAQRLSDGHPGLLQAVAGHLRQHDWNPSNMGLEQLLSGAYAGTVADETLKRLLDRVGDERSQELLYRLNLIPGPFELRHARLVGSAPPEIDRVRQRVLTLSGGWVVREADDTYRVAALARRLGSDELTRSTRQAVHHALAEDVLAQHLVDQHALVRAVSHLLGAGEFDRMAVLFASGLEAVGDRQDLEFVAFWAKTALPDGIRPALQVLVRARQLECFARLGRDISFVAGDLLLLTMTVDREEAWTLPLAAVTTARTLARWNFREALRVLARTLSLSPTLTRPNGEPLGLPEEIHLESLLWFVLGEERNERDLHAWLDVLGTLSPEQRARVKAAEPADGGWRGLADRVWMLQADRPQNEQDWPETLAVLGRLAGRALDLGLPLLWAWSVQGQMVVCGEYLRNLGAAEQITQAALEHAPNLPDVRFLLFEGLGRQFVFARQYDAAVPWLERALAEGGERYVAQRAHARLHLARALGVQNADAATRLARDAVGLLRSLAEEWDLLLIQALGELAVCAWASDERAEAADALDEAAARLWRIRDRTEGWSRAFVALGQVVAAFTQDITGGTDAAKTAIREGQLPAYRGFFAAPPIELAAFDTTLRRGTFYGAMTSFFAALNDDARAAQWALRALDAEDVNLVSQGSIAPQLVAALLSEDRFDAAFDAAWLGTTAMVAVRRLHQEDMPDVLPGLTAAQVLGEKPSLDWKTAEQMAMAQGVEVAAYRLGLIALENSNRAAEQARTLAAVCRQVAQDAVEPDMWTAAAELLDVAFDRGFDWQNLVRRGNAAAHRSWPSVHVLAYVAACSQGRVPVRAAWRMQQILPPRVQQIQTPVSFRRVVWPFFEAYWRRQLRVRRFAFRLPDRVERQFETAATTPEEVRLERILKAIEVGI